MSRRWSVIPVALLLQACAIAAPQIEHVDVFVSGQEGYHTFRIPVIEATPDGSLVVFAEGRKYNRHDPGHHNNDIDLVMKRSTDGGRTWGALIVSDDPGEKWSACNPTTVTDRTNGRVWLFYNRLKPGRSSRNARAGANDSTAWARYTDDNGVSWSDPVDLTHTARDFHNWGSCFFGPGGAIQDRTGTLIVPLAKTPGGGDNPNTGADDDWRAYVIYSDDHGKRWKRGDLFPGPSYTNENQLVELATGQVLMDARQTRPLPHRLVATTTNNGKSWSKPQPGQIVTTVACAIERYTLKSSGDDRNRILWTGPKGPKRNHLVVRVSYDEAKTFTNERTISPEPAAYSDLTILRDDRVGVIWERGDTEVQYKFVTFTAFTREFLDD